MVQGGDGMSFALEALGEELAGEFDGDVAAQAWIRRFVDLAHSAGADGGQDFIGTELRTHRKRHGDVAQFSRSRGVCEVHWEKTAGNFFRLRRIGGFLRARRCIRK